MQTAFSIPLPNVADYVISAVCLIAIAISWYYFFRYFAAVKYSTEELNKPLPAVSLVVAAKNELQNLEKNIPIWLGQDYPKFELIIADDGSTDGTSAWITTQFEHEPRVKLVLLDAEYVKMHGKKIALTLAFKKAQFAHFVLTDADCTPTSNLWLQQMAGRFGNGKEIVLGYSPYIKKSGILNKIIRFETVMTALHYIGFALKGKPYMGVGRNLAYTRSVYDKQNGFAAHSHLPAGDDDLFVQSAATSNNTAVCFTPESFTYSLAKTSFKQWHRQKRRHIWVGKFYKSSVKNSLAWFPLAQFVFFIAAGYWFFSGTWFVYPLAFLLIKWIPEWIIFGIKSKKLASPDLTLWYPILNLYHSLWFILAGVGAFFAKRPKW